MQDIIDFILRVFSLTPEEIASIISSIQDSIIATIRSAYKRWSKLVGSALDWSPPKDVIASVAKLAKEHAQSIAETYHRELENTTSTFVDAYEQANDSLEGIYEPLTGLMDEWTGARALSKSKQIAMYETGCGAERGTSLFVRDLRTNDIIRTQTGEIIDPSKYAITVEPGEASNDICREYAGQTFDLDDFDNLPQWPAHPNCPHRTILIPI